MFRWTLKKHILQYLFLMNVDVGKAYFGWFFCYKTSSWGKQLNLWFVFIVYYIESPACGLFCWPAPGGGHGEHDEHHAGGGQIQPGPHNHHQLQHPQCSCHPHPQKRDGVAGHLKKENKYFFFLKNKIKYNKFATSKQTY